MPRPFLLILGAVVGVLAGYFIFHAPKAFSGGTHVVAVFGDPKEDDDPSAAPEKLHMNKDETVSWIATSPRKFVRVEFKEEVFKGMTRKGNPPDVRYVPKRCEQIQRQCDSQEVKVKPDPTKEYKYWQFLHDEHGNGRNKDGWIIIDR
jgi:hypothetical protein